MDLLASAVPPLIAWYEKNKRDLPWRRDRDAYHVWISEIMLQQTRVEAAKGYYLRFLERFPDVFALARADEEEVLKAWEGLGYYSRARNLKKAAERIAAEGAFPQTWEGMRALPGIGDYTAGAVLSIAYDLPYPAVDGNVLRILTRLLADGSNIDDPATRRRFSELLKEVYPVQAGEFTQALMELGALVCIPNGDPLCLACPWQGLCRAKREGRQTEYPVRAEKRARKVVPVDVNVLTAHGKYAIEKRPAKGLLSGLWQFPLGAAPPGGALIETQRARHVFTHVEWEMTGRLVRLEEEIPPYVWVTAEELKEKYALPSAFKPFFGWLK